MRIIKAKEVVTGDKITVALGSYNYLEATVLSVKKMGILLEFELTLGLSDFTRIYHEEQEIELIAR